MAGEYPTYSIAYHTPKELVRIFDSAVQFAVVGVRTDSSMDDHTGGGHPHDASNLADLKEKYSTFIQDKGPHYQRIDDYPTITVVGAKSLESYEDVFAAPPGTTTPSSSSSSSTQKHRVGMAPEGFTGELTAKDLWYNVVEPQLRRLMEPKCLGPPKQQNQQEYTTNENGELIVGDGGGFEEEHAANNAPIVIDDDGAAFAEDGMYVGDDGMGGGGMDDTVHLTPPNRPPIRPVSGVETAVSPDELFVGEAGLLDLCALLYPLSPSDEVAQDAFNKEQLRIYEQQQLEHAGKDGGEEGGGISQQPPEVPWMMTQRRMLELFEEATAASQTETARLRQKEAEAAEKEVAEVLGRLDGHPSSSDRVSGDDGDVVDATVGAKSQESYALRPKEYAFANGTLNWSS